MSLRAFGCLREAPCSIARARGALVEATAYLQEALHTFAALPAPFEVGCTYLELAILTRAQGDHQAAAAHLMEAYVVFRHLQAPRYVERAEQLAREWGVALADILS